MLYSLADDAATQRSRIPRKLRRVRHAVLTKLDLQRRLAEQDGSSDVISGVLCLTRGLARVVQQVQNEHYTAAARDMIQSVEARAFAGIRSPTAAMV